MGYLLGIRKIKQEFCNALGSWLLHEDKGSLPFPAITERSFGRIFEGKSVVPEAGVLEPFD
jgi:hypothetical protein